MLLPVPGLSFPHLQTGKGLLTYGSRSASNALLALSVFIVLYGHLLVNYNFCVALSAPTTLGSQGKVCASIRGAQSWRCNTVPGVGQGSGIKWVLNPRGFPPFRQSS